MKQHIMVSKVTVRSSRRTNRSNWRESKIFSTIWMWRRIFDFSWSHVLLSALRSVLGNPFFTWWSRRVLGPNDRHESHLLSPWALIPLWLLSQRTWFLFMSDWVFFLAPRFLSWLLAGRLKCWRDVRRWCVTPMLVLSLRPPRTHIPPTGGGGPRESFSSR